MNIKLPKDAEGREIPRNTEVMYDINGKRVHITGYTYKCDVLGLWQQWKVSSPDITGEKDGMLPADSLYLTPPDSWEKLEDDLDRCISGNSICRYCSTSGSCKDCTIGHFNDCDRCEELAFKDIKKRIRKLRGED